MQIVVLINVLTIALVAICSRLSAAAVTATHAQHVPAIRAPEAPWSSAVNVQQQYHTQDIYGQYAYGYSEPTSSKQEVRTSDGVTRGTYSYIDAEGKLQTVRYIADAAGGFRVAATNLPTAAGLIAPTPVTETPEVAAARAQHLAAHREQLLRIAMPHLHVPQAVEDTPEVAAAKVEFFKRYEEEKLRHQLLRERNAAVTLQKLNATPLKAFVYDVIAPQRTYLPVIA